MGDYYSSPIRQQGMPSSDYYQRISNLKLLHIDLDLVKENFKIREELSNLEKIKKTIQKYQKSLDKTNLKDLKDKYNILLKDKNNFIIAKNYDQIKEDADKLTEKLNKLRNKFAGIKEQLQRKNTNLLSSENINIDSFEIEKLYKEIEFFFNEKIIKRVEDAQEFHNQLIYNRKKRIKIEIKELNLEKETIEKKIEKISILRDEKLNLLDKEGALEEYYSIEENLRLISDEIEKYTRYEKLLSDFKIKKGDLDLQAAIVKQKSILYLEQNKEKFEKIEDNFRKIVKQFYNNHGGSLKIKETKTAKYLYDIEIKIPRSGSQGISNVEIFCYDILLYKLNRNLLNFLAHDGYIFSGMDPRQKAMIFKIVIELIQKYDLQYFININENILNEILESNILTKSEKDFINKNIILTLYDKNPESWLLGEKFN